MEHFMLEKIQTSETRKCIQTY